MIHALTGVLQAYLAVATGVERVIYWEWGSVLRGLVNQDISFSCWVPILYARALETCWTFDRAVWVPSVRMLLSKMEPAMDEAHQKEPSHRLVEVSANGSAVPEYAAGLYPEFAIHGDVAGLIQSELQRRGSNIFVKSMAPSSGVGISCGRRDCQMFIAVKERLFMAEFTERGIVLATLDTKSVALLIDAALAWCGQETNLGAFKSLSSWIKIRAVAEAYAAGPEVMVRFGWEGLLKWLSQETNAYLPLLFRRVVEMAIETTELSRLYPYFNQSRRLCFSRCTGVPYSDDCPEIGHLPTSAFRVHARPSDSVLGEGNADEAVALTIKHLPPNCGPAIHGTEEDLKAV